MRQILGLRGSVPRPYGDTIQRGLMKSTENPSKASLGTIGAYWRGIWGPFGATWGLFGAYLGPT